MDEKSSKELFDNVLCPCFDIIPSLKKKYEDEKYNQLLKQQAKVLNFLKDQKTAAIAGTSGTGKTMIALERARRLAENDKVLFLCYNPNLKDFLQKDQRNSKISFYTIDGFACAKNPKHTADYNLLREILFYEISEDKFIYNHIIVDEGQDFGRKEIEESGIMNLLFDYGKNHHNSSFYVFYDKFQLVNCAESIPTFINEADSKITLYKNCRNTKKIAESAYSLIESKVKVEMPDRAIIGNDVKMFYYENEQELIHRLDNMINSSAKNNGYERAIISCKSLSSHGLINFIDKFGFFKSSKDVKVKVYSASTFKGLEADDIFLIDVDENSFDDNNLSFYVGASRAKKNLYIFVNMNENQANNIINKKFPDSFPSSSKKYQLASRMHATYVK